MKSSLAKILVEAGATFLSLVIAFGGIAVFPENVWLRAGAFGFGLALALTLGGRNLGGYLNPSLLVALVIARGIPAWLGVIYFLAQLLGAFGAALLVSLLTTPATREALLPDTEANAWTLVVTVGLSFLFVVAVLYLTRNRQPLLLTALVIGFNFAAVSLALALLGWPHLYLNPVATLAAAWTFGGVGWGYWIARLGPVLGGAAAAIVELALWGERRTAPTSRGLPPLRADDAPGAAGSALNTRLGQPADPPAIDPPDAEINGSVVIASVLYTGDECVIIRNISTRPAQIGGWQLQDRNDTRHRYRFPAGTQLAPGASLAIYTPPGYLYSFASPTPLWNNRDAELVLLDETGALVSNYAYARYQRSNAPRDAGPEVDGSA